MALSTVKSIQIAIDLVESKKENLRKAFEELQLHSYLLPSLAFTWNDIESYVDSARSDLLGQLAVIQAQSSSRIRKPKQTKQFAPEQIPARPELKSLCENMDGLGLRKYVLDRPKERTDIRVELADALKHAPDPSSLILDALDGFGNGGLDSSSRSEQLALRRACAVLLEEFMRTGFEIRAEVKERAKAMATEWMGTASALPEGNDGDEDGEKKEEIGGLKSLGYLQLLAAYKLVSDGGYDVNELIKYVVSIAKYRQAVGLCQILELESWVSDIVQELIAKGKQLLALKFVFEYELIDEFPPVPLLKEHVMYSEKLAQEVRKNGKASHQSLNAAALKEINALKEVIKCVEDHNLDSEYPKSILIRRIEKLEKERTDRKKPAAAAVLKPHQQVKRQQQNGNKRMRATLGPIASKKKVPAKPFVHPSQGLLLDHTAPYLSTSAGAYGMAGPVVPAVPYAGSSSVYYGLSGAALSGLNPIASSSYPSEPHAQQYAHSGYHDGAVVYAGYNMPSHYHPVYYQQ